MMFGLWTTHRINSRDEGFADYRDSPPVGSMVSALGPEASIVETSDDGDPCAHVLRYLGTQDETTRHAEAMHDGDWETWLADWRTWRGRHAVLGHWMPPLRAPVGAFWGTLPVLVLADPEDRKLVAVALNLNDTYALPRHPACELARQPVAGSLAWVCHWVAAADVRLEPFALERADEENDG